MEGNKMKKTILIVVITLVGIAAFAVGTNNVEAKTYTVGPNSKPARGFSTNKNNHGYFLIRSYMQKFEGHGGTLVLKKGTYRISNAIFVPSNVTIKFKDGVKLVKTNGPSSSMFQLLADSKYGRSNVTKKHNGEKNIKFIGKGKVILDMKNKNPHGANAIGIVMGNNKNVTIQGITFKNIKKGHMIEMDGCKNVKIIKCKFMNMKTNKYYNKEAINLDTNDKKTGGFSQKWSKRDKTPNYNVTIKDCKFHKLMRAVGTHRYSKGKFHTKIKFINNKVTKVSTPLGIVNWKDSVIKNNKFSDCKVNAKFNYNFLLAGVRNLTFTKNTMEKCNGYHLVKYENPYQTSYETYPPTKSKWTAANLKAFKDNKAIKCSSNYVYIDDHEFEW